MGRHSPTPGLSPRFQHDSWPCQDAAPTFLALCVLQAEAGLVALGHLAAVGGQEVIVGEDVHAVIVPGKRHKPKALHPQTHSGRGERRGDPRGVLQRSPETDTVGGVRARGRPGRVEEGKRPRDMHEGGILGISWGHGPG